MINTTTGFHFALSTIAQRINGKIVFCGSFFVFAVLEIKRAARNTFHVLFQYLIQIIHHFLKSFHV